VTISRMVKNFSKHSCRHLSY